MLTDAQVRERDGDRCARCGGNRGGLHIHHRWRRSAGSDERDCNRVTLCAYCHRWVHGNPEQAMEQGWLVSRYADPAGVPVVHWMWPAGPVLLAGDGGIRIWIDETP